MGGNGGEERERERQRDPIYLKPKPGALNPESELSKL